MTYGPLPRATAWRAVGRCVVTTADLLRHRRIHQPSDNVGRVLRFADGTAARVYRETVVDRSPSDPCVLVVSFRLRGVRGSRGHSLFRTESILNTVLFVGFPGMVSKLWLAHDEHGTYRGVYEWDGSERAESYARSLWRVLELVSSRGSIHYHITPGVRRDQVLAAQVPSGSPGEPSGPAGPSGPAEWWRVVAS